MPVPFFGCLFAKLVLNVRIDYSKSYFAWHCFQWVRSAWWRFVALFFFIPFVCVFVIIFSSAFRQSPSEGIWQHTLLQLFKFIVTFATKWIYVSRWALVLGCCLWIICLYCFYCLVKDDLYLLTTWLPVHGLFFMVDCVWLCCLTYVIVWMSRVKASFKCWSILITNLGKQSSFSPSVSFFMCLCCCIGDFSFHNIYYLVRKCATWYPSLWDSFCGHWPCFPSLPHSYDGYGFCFYYLLVKGTLLLHNLFLLMSQNHSCSGCFKIVKNKRQPVVTKNSKTFLKKWQVRKNFSR